MDIRTKLIFGVGSATLASLFLLGAFALHATTSLVRESSARQLEALAEIKQKGLEEVFEGWRDRVRLVTSPMSLREGLHRYERSGDVEELSRIDQALRDALAAVDDLRRLTVYDRMGRPVTSQGHARIPAAERLEIPGSVELGPAFADRTDPDRGDRGDVELAIRAPLLLDGEPIGAVEVVQDVDEIESVTSAYSGLEESGEAYVVMRRADGRLSLLSGLRQGGATDGQGPARAPLRPLTRVSPVSEERAAPPSVAIALQAALASESRTPLGPLSDSPDEPIQAATRSLPLQGWSLVVQKDAADVDRQVGALRSQLIDLSLSLSAIAMLVAVSLGLYLARPIRQLAELVDRVRAGEVGLRADSRGEDEIGFLGRAINGLLDDRQRSSPRGPRQDVE